MDVELATPARLAMEAHARATWPSEACGAVFGERLPGGALRATIYRPLANRAVDPRAGFEVDPFELCAVEGSERDAGRTLLGLFHSHPEGPPTPSRRDRRADWPGFAAWIGGFAPDRTLVLAVRPLTGARLSPDAQNRSV